MFKITLSPTRADRTIHVAVAGSALLVNDQSFDLSPLGEGDTLPFEALPAEIFGGPIHKEDGVYHVTLIFPHGPNPPAHVAYPEPITVTADGSVALPE